MEATNERDEKCLSCYDSGEIVTELGPAPCPDCAGAPGGVSPWELTERRLRDIERRFAGSDVGTEVDWMIFELRRSRSALLRILARCQDAGAEDEFAAEIRFLANEATRMYRRIP